MLGSSNAEKNQSSLQLKKLKSTSLEYAVVSLRIATLEQIYLERPEESRGFLELAKDTTILRSLEELFASLHSLEREGLEKARNAVYLDSIVRAERKKSREEAGEHVD